MSEKTPEQLKKELLYDPWPNCPPDGCNQCEDTACPQRCEEEIDEDFDTCPYTGEECLREFLRANTGCIGCEIQDRPTEEELALKESQAMPEAKP